MKKTLLTLTALSVISFGSLAASPVNLETECFNVQIDGAAINIVEKCAQENFEFGWTYETPSGSYTMNVGDKGSFQIIDSRETDGAPRLLTSVSGMDTDYPYLTTDKLRFDPVTGEVFYSENPTYLPFLKVDNNRLIAESNSWQSPFMFYYENSEHKFTSSEGVLGDGVDFETVCGNPVKSPNVAMYDGFLGELHTDPKAYCEEIRNSTDWWNQ